MKHPKPKKTVVALFEDLHHAQRGVEALQREDVAPSSIGLLVRAPESMMDLPGGLDRARGIQPTDVAPTHVRTTHDGRTRMPEGIAPSTVGVGTLLVGLAALTVPAIGPVLAMGPLGAAMATGGTPSSSKSVDAVLVDAGVPEAEAAHYVAAIRRGKALVMATVDAAKAERIARSLAQCGPLSDFAEHLDVGT